MAPNHLILLILAFCSWASCDDLPTLYEYYTGDGITSGLSIDQPYFTLNGKNFSIYSGAMHYFRVPPQYWQDRLRKLRAAGLNTVETYIAWNLHEIHNGVFDFGDGGTDMEEFLDIERYIQLAQAEDLLMIVRVGPYITAEWDYGGIPSWLLTEGAKPRTTDKVYYKYVQRFFNELVPILAKYQFTRGGPIVMLQIENEYGAGAKQQSHMQQLYDLMVDNDIVEPLCSSDPVRFGTDGTLPGKILQTINSQNPADDFPTLEEMQPGKPLIAMEMYPGWFDAWFGEHSTRSVDDFREAYEDVLAYPGSINIYMFHGGSDWAFFSGAGGSGADNSHLSPITTSYDYDAPISEAGDYTEKYDIIKQLLEKYDTIKTKIPEPPELVERQTYPTLSIDGYLSMEDVIKQAPIELTDQPTLPMEKLPINDNSGQGYGYIVYRVEDVDLPADSLLTIAGYLSDTLIVFVNGELISKPLSNVDDLDGFGYWRLENSSITLTSTDLEGATVDLVFEGWGRRDYGGMTWQFKGLFGSNQVFINDDEITSWTIYPLEFRKAWVNDLSWNSIQRDEKAGPGLYKATFTIDSDDDYNYDNFIDMQEWNKGMVLVNGFALGKYVFLGPQEALYLPRPFLQKGDNEIVVFEHFEAAAEIRFSKDPIYRNP